MEQGIIMLHNELHDKWLDWLKGSKLTVAAIHPVGGAESVRSLGELIAYVNSETGKNYLDRLRALGLKVEFEYHAMSWLLPREEFHSHPDWFRMDGQGERTPDVNLCPSNSEALSYIEDRAELLAHALPTDTGKYYIWQDDVEGKGCCCPKCKKLSISDQILLMMHAVLKGLRRTDPVARLSYLAYFDTLEVPHIRPEDGIFLEFAPFKRNLSLPLNHPASPDNLSQSKTLLPLLAHFGKRDSCALEYWIDNSLQSDFKRPPKELILHQDVILQDIAFYKSLGFEKITSFAGYLDDEYCRLYGEPPVRRYANIF